MDNKAEISFSSIFGDCPVCGNSWRAHGETNKNRKRSPSKQYSYLIAYERIGDDKTSCYICPFCDSIFDLNFKLVDIKRPEWCNYPLFEGECKAFKNNPDLEKCCSKCRFNVGDHCTIEPLQILGHGQRQ